MEIDEYIKSRVDNQINWYDQKSASCQRKYKLTQTIEIVLAALIPLLSAYSKDCVLIALIVGALGAAIAIIESLTKLYKWHENWIEYRTTCELLRYQKHLFVTKSSPYNIEPENVENIFVRNIENIISSENNKWKAVNTNEKKVEKGNKNFLSGLFRQQIFIPIAALIILAVFNLIVDPSFFKITLGYNSAGDPVLSGYLMTILDYGSELAILAIGMTLVTAASGGQDISVGAAIAIAGSVILRVLCGTNSRPDTLQAPIIVAFLVACVVAMLFGAFNGALVAYFKIQPMVATLILYTAGRSIAAWINNNELPIVSDPTFSYFGGFIPGIPIPTPFFIAAVCVLVIFLVLKFTTLGLYTQSVGINENSSKLNGLNPTFIKFLTFVILGLCVAVAALIKVSRLSSINYSVIAKDIEMDAILAVALGGNSLSGGKFNMAASILGAYVIQFLTTTLYKFDVQSDALPAYKAVVVILLVVLSTPKVREWLSAFGKKLKQGKAVKEVG